jgi:hypothetical protein
MTTTDTDNALGVLARALQNLTETTVQSGSTEDLTPVVLAIQAATAVAYDATSKALAPLVAANAALVTATLQAQPSLKAAPSVSVQAPA